MGENLLREVFSVLRLAAIGIADLIENLAMLLDEGFELSAGAFASAAPTELLFARGR